MVVVHSTPGCRCECLMLTGSFGLKGDEINSIFEFSELPCGIEVSRTTLHGTCCSAEGDQLLHSFLQHSQQEQAADQQRP